MIRAGRIAGMVLAALVAGRSVQAGPFADPGVPLSAPVAWADGVVALTRGPQDIANPTGPLASFGSASDALGPASGVATDVVSLGDGGSITLSFTSGIENAPGVDLAVFENGFATLGGLFAELAFVEVSSDGTHFARFPATSLTPAPVGAFDPLNPTDLHNLAGKHPAGEGTGFDLADLAGDPLVQAGLVDLSHIFFVRLVDVIGDGSTLDAGGRAIYDPYPTPFASGGFDLDGVGVLHPVPEPAALALVLAGLAALGALRWKRRALAPALATAGLVAALTVGGSAHALVADLEDLPLAPESFYNGSDGAGGFSSRGVFFNNDYNATFGSWRGFSYSNVTDNTTPGFGNQYSAWPGSGAGGSANYAVAFAFDPDFATVLFPAPSRVAGAYVANTTYAALTMRDGDPFGFAKKFGGPTGNDPDWFRLTVRGWDAAGRPTGAVDFYLADYRFADPAQDYILDTWAFVDLSPLGVVSKLSFSLASSDTGPFGINTPAYFAIDDITATPVPEPASAALLALGLAALGVRRRRR